MPEYQGDLYGDITLEKDDVDGKIIDFLTGRPLNNTPEEKRRQEIERKLVEHWGYPKNLISIEETIHFGSNKYGRVDIVVYKDDKSRDVNKNAHIIVEVKRDSKNEGVEQLESYINASSAEFGIWYNGKDRIYLRKTVKPLELKEISRIPKYLETFEDLEKQIKKKDLKPDFNLSGRFDEIHNYLYANEGFLKETLFGEIVKIIFMKIVDEKLPNEDVYFWISESEYEEILHYSKSQFFENRMQTLWNQTRNLYPEVDGNLQLRLSSIAEIVRRLQEISFERTRDDIKGTAFQVFIHENMRGNRGEFFTPQPAIEIAVDMLKPDYHESIIDPACGTGRFLTMSMEHVKAKYNLDSRGIVDYARSHISGIDINPDLVKVAKMYMVLMGDGWSNILSANSLNLFSDLKNYSLESRIPKSATAETNKFDIVLTNPPFGSKGRVNNSKILSQFELARKWRFEKASGKWIMGNETVKEQTPEILFVERCVQLLKENGRMGIVLPEGLLNNSSLGYVRQWLMDNTRIIGVVSLPEETFTPYGTGTKASLLFVQKLSTDDLSYLKERGYKIFMASVTKIGYDVRGRTLFKRDDSGNIMKDSTGASIIDNDLEEVVKAFDQFRKENDLGF